jgi:hypothetical protein
LKKRENTFKCLRCGRCCEWKGYVRLENSDIDAISSYLGLSVYDFTGKYTVLTSDRRNLSLKEKENGNCIFLSPDSGRCLIHEAKPAQCVKFPIEWNYPGWENECEWGKHNISIIQSNRDDDN